MGDKTAHFDFREFTCKCGCSTNRTSDELINKAEQIYQYLDKTADGVSAVIINSGYRCTAWSQKLQGAFVGDTHNLGIGMDFHAIKADGVSNWSAYELAAVCEHLGFNGIAIITNHDVHADLRNGTNYANAHWFGNEMTGDNEVKSFLQYLPKQVDINSNAKHKFKVYYDDKLIFESEV